MTIYRNKNWTRRNYECTNIVAVVSDTKPTVGWNGEPADYWVQAVDQQSLGNLEQIGSFAGMTFYGYL